MPFRPLLFCPFTILHYKALALSGGLALNFMPLASHFFIYPPVYASKITIQSFRNSTTADYFGYRGTVPFGTMTSADHADRLPSPFQFTNQQEDQPNFFISANHASSSVSCPSFCNIIRDHGEARVLEESPNDHEDGSQNSNMAGSSNHQMCSASTLSVSEMDENICGHYLGLQKFKLEEDDTNISSSAQWLPSKMRLMHRMMTANRAAADKPIKNFPRLLNQQHRSSEANTGSSAINTGNNPIRVCSDCNTTTTPLWRSGPRGPKSLCNACGIRQRKQRKATTGASAAAANGLVVPEASSEKIGKVMHGKEKKSRSAGAAACASQGDQRARRLSFNDLKLSWSDNSASQQVLFPQDEVAEAAILLMELSCGFLHV